MSTERGPRRALFLFLGALAGAAAANVLARHWLDVVEVAGGSMAPALQPGDRLLVEAVTYRSRLPRVGEIVLAADPRDPSRELVKRVAASGPSLQLRGDARDASTDSRIFGAVPLAAVRWRVVARYWPPARATRL
jgi:nickel-type superoxide dismutase maturation protease